MYGLRRPIEYGDEITSNTQDFSKSKRLSTEPSNSLLAMNKRPYTKPFDKNLPEGYSPTPENIANF